MEKRIQTKRYHVEILLVFLSRVPKQILLTNFIFFLLLLLLQLPAPIAEEKRIQTKEDHVEILLLIFISRVSKKNTIHSLSYFWY